MGQYHPSYYVMLRYKWLLLLGNENRRLCGEVFANIPSQKTRLRHLGWCGRGHLQTVIRYLVKDQFQGQGHIIEIRKFHGIRPIYIVSLKTDPCS